MGTWVGGRAWLKGNLSFICNVLLFLKKENGFIYCLQHLYIIIKRIPVGGGGKGGRSKINYVSPGRFRICGGCSVPQSCLTLCGHMHGSTPGFPALHHLLEPAQTHVH